MVIFHSYVSLPEGMLAIFAMNELARNLAFSGLRQHFCQMCQCCVNGEIPTYLSNVEVS